MFREDFRIPDPLGSWERQLTYGKRMGMHPCKDCSLKNAFKRAYENHLIEDTLDLETRLKSGSSRFEQDYMPIDKYLLPEKFEKKYRIKNRTHLIKLGQVLGHCLGSFARANPEYLFFRYETVCASVDLDFTQVVQCWDAKNLVTHKSLIFKKFLEKVIKIVHSPAYIQKKNKLIESEETARNSKDNLENREYDQSRQPHMNQDGYAAIWDAYGQQQQDQVRDIKGEELPFLSLEDICDRRDVLPRAPQADLEELWDPRVDEYYDIINMPLDDLQRQQLVNDPEFTNLAQDLGHAPEEILNGYKYENKILGPIPKISMIDNIWICAVYNGKSSKNTR